MRYSIICQGIGKSFDWGLWFNTEAEAQAIVDQYGGVYVDDDGFRYDMYIVPEYEEGM